MSNEYAACVALDYGLDMTYNIYTDFTPSKALSKSCAVLHFGLGEPLTAKNFIYLPAAFNSLQIFKYNFSNSSCVLFIVTETVDIFKCP